MKRLFLSVLLFVPLATSDMLKDGESLQGVDVINWLDNPTALINLDPPPAPCKADEIEYKGNLYTSFLTPFYDDMLTIRNGYVPPGLYMKAIVKDSAVYIVDAGVCFEENEDYKTPAGDTITHIPLKILFPEASSDTIKATSLTNYLELYYKNDVKVLLIVKKGKVTRSYEQGTPSEGKFRNDEEYYHFQRYEAEKCENRPECERDSNPEFVKLMQRLKPYYGEKRWKIAKMLTRKLDEKALDESDNQANPPE